MTDAAIFVFLTFTVVSYASFISYGGTDKALRLALGVIMLSALLSAISHVSASDLSFPGEDLPPPDLSSVGEDAALEAFCEGVKSAVAEEFGLSVSDISVEASRLRKDAPRVSDIKITLYGRAALADTDGVRDYLIKNRLCDNATVKISFGERESGGE